MGSRTRLALGVVLAVLLAGLGVVQYRWSAKVAATDAQREQERLEAASSLFADHFNGVAAQAVQFLQNNAWRAQRSAKPLGHVPKFFDALYYVESSPRGAIRVSRFNAAGALVPASPPRWMGTPRCAAAEIRGPTQTTSAYNVAALESPDGSEKLIFETFGREPGECMVARVGEAYLRNEIIPRLIRQSFGQSAAKQYNFAVVWRSRPTDVVYGHPTKVDLRKPFFSLAPEDLPVSRTDSASGPTRGPLQVTVRRVESTISTGTATRPGNLFGTGIWELLVAHNGDSLTSVFARRRRRDILFSLGVEALLFAAILLLVVAARQSHQLSKQRMQFVAAVSHELRAPLSAIAMLSRNQADGLVADPARVKEYGTLIHEQSQRLNEMVEQTLGYAGMQARLRQKSRGEVDLRRLVEDALGARKEELERSGFTVEVRIENGLKPVRGDASLLRIALDNLLSNAQKHAAVGRWIRETAEHCAQNKQVRLTVEDRGRGINPEEQADIFEPFRRGKAAMEAQVPGSGLGLSVARSAAEANGGRLTLASEQGKGSTFTIHLPARSAFYSSKMNRRLRWR